MYNYRSLFTMKQNGVERSRLRGLKKAGDYVEVTFSPDDNYLACVYKAVDVLGWKYDPVPHIYAGLMVVALSINLWRQGVGQLVHM